MAGEEEEGGEERRLIDLHGFAAGKKPSLDPKHPPSCLDNEPRFDDPESARRHAVDAPVGVAVVVADSDGEAAVVGPDDSDGAALVALDPQRAALAAVLGPPVEAAVVTAPWKGRGGEVGIDSTLINTPPLSLITVCCRGPAGRRRAFSCSRERQIIDLSPR